MDEVPTALPQAAIGGEWEPEATAEALGALADERRLAVLAALWTAEREGRAASFSELQEAAGTDTSAGFAYHLRQLVGRYLRKTERGYELTPAGRRVARATGSEGAERRRLGDTCPFCGARALAATYGETEVGVACEDCGRDVVGVPLPADDPVVGDRRAS
jgi:hypothetical protein